MKKTTKLSAIIGGLFLAGASTSAMATCADVVGRWNSINNIMGMVVGQIYNNGYGLPMWATLVDETGKVCAVYNSSPNIGDTIGNYSWLGSRVISMQKANTANAFSLDAFSISTANLYGLTQPGGSLYGLQLSNPVDPNLAYAGASANFGNGINDPAVGKRIGGINVFGGGLALYSGSGVKIGAIGVSGDTSCTDHAVAWKLRYLMALDNVPGGFVKGNAINNYPWTKGDEMIISTNVTNTYYHPSCKHNDRINPTTGPLTGVIDTDRKSVV